MKAGKLYIKIFLSFLLVLVITEILVFGLFLHSAGRIFRSRFERHTRAQVMMAKEFVEEKIKTEPLIHPAENESLKNLFRRLGEAHRAKIWLAAPDGTVLLKSFLGDIPEDVARISGKRTRGVKGFRTRNVFWKGQFFHITIPIGIGNDEVGSLHILSEGIGSDHHQGAFALGLAAIGLVIALLIIPVSRLITEPLKHLRHSALQIAEGDLSHRASVKSQDEIGELGRSFNRMAGKLERMIRGGRELTANISHELRSPLARIRVAEELLRGRLDRGDHNEWKRHLDDIREDVEEADRLIDQILVLSKLDIHETSLKRERVDPSKLINELLERLEPAIKHRSLRVVKDLSFNPPIFGDRDVLRTALSNVLENAVKFTAENGGVIVKMHPENDCLKISVTNSFDPLSKEDLARIFEPFYRTERSQATGSGLGLAITKRIIEKHGGQVEADNSAEGLRIQMRLPVGLPEEGI